MRRPWRTGLHDVVVPPVLSHLQRCLPMLVLQGHIGTEGGREREREREEREREERERARRERGGEREKEREREKL